MLKPESANEFVEIVEPELTRELVDAFRRATLSEFSPGFPLTFATTFRKSEFKWLNKLQVDLRNLLHTEQQYEFLIPFELADIPTIRTKIIDIKERKSKRGCLTIVVLESSVLCAAQLKVRTTTTFVLREDAETA